MKVLICKRCGNQVEVINDSGVSMVCCGEKMHELDSKAFDGAKEKHVPEYKVNQNLVEVVVSSVLHPMEEKHYITWIAVETNKGIQRKWLKPNDEPKATFALDDGEEEVKVYSYCNLHGLWEA